ncbi:glutathione S-transferase 1 [Helicoverpa armigera]|uniref:glutathione S-transferase 1 n=1 Tax=Helicoverpa armigera TaxID=29058 RepID=UPI003083812C
MTLKLYKKDPSPPVRAVLMLAELLKLELELYDMDMVNCEHLTPEYMEKNPLHSVPLLEEDDFCLADSHAILTYLVSKYGGEQQATLYPSDLRLRATIDQRLHFDTSILFPAIKSIVKVLICHDTASASDEILVHAAYDTMDRYLQKSKFVAGDNLTVADVSCIASISTLEFMVPIHEKYAKLREWFEMLKEEEWYKKGNEAGLFQVNIFLKKKKDLTGEEKCMKDSDDE